MAYVILILVIGGMLYYLWSKQKQAKENGDIIDRDGAFFKQNHDFTTHINSIDTIFHSIDQNPLTRNKMSCSLTSGQCIEFDGYHMTAALRILDKRDDLTIYRYSIEHYTATNGTKPTFIGNVALTAVEKAIFKLDSTAQVERTQGSYKSKLKLF